MLKIKNSEEIGRKKTTIGVLGITIPGVLYCIEKINSLSKTNYPDFFSARSNPQIIMKQRNFEPTYRAQVEGTENKVIDKMLVDIHDLKRSGASFVIIPANTAHYYIKEIQEASDLPVLSMLDEVVRICVTNGLKKIGVLGTSWTMNNHLYQHVFSANGVEEIVPTNEEQAFIHQTIVEELIPSGACSPEALNRILEIVNRLESIGCDGVALACTELPLILNQLNCRIKLLDTTAIIAGAAVREYTRLKREEKLLKASHYANEYINQSTATNNAIR